MTIQLMSNRDRMVTKIEHVIALEYDQLNFRLANQEIDLATYEEEAQLIEDWARDMYNDMDR